MRLFLTVVLVGALAGCAELEKIGTSVRGAVAAGIDAVAAEAPGAVKEIVDDPGMGSVAKAGSGLLIAFVSGAAGYFAVKRYKKA